MPRGFRAAGGTCGIKASGQPDLTLIVADQPCTAAGVFTKSTVAGAPVIVAKRHLRASGNVARAIICNSGNANTATGEQGRRDAVAMCKLVAKQIDCDDHRHILPSSTGLIGAALPMDRIRQAIPSLVPQLKRGAQADADAAHGILTTDLVMKTACRRVRLGGQAGKVAHVAGICKGSGMIAPNMATMLAFITTDAAIGSHRLSIALHLAVAVSFNRISVDEDTSPNDMAIVLASGAAGNRRIIRKGADEIAFTTALCDLCRDLAYQMVKDGEGATKVFRVKVMGARSQRDADRIGKAIVGSPLVKTAIHGGDPNWGRIVAAIGRSGGAVRPDRLSIAIGDVGVFSRGQAAKLKVSVARKLNRIMQRKEVLITVGLDFGQAETEWLGCDLSRQYIAINADYTT